MSTPTIDRDGRDALVELMGYRFFVRDETGLADEHSEEAPIARYRDDLQLMTDLAWLPRRRTGVARGRPGRVRILA